MVNNPPRAARAAQQPGAVTIGIELSATHKRICALPVGAEPNKDESNIEKRLKFLDSKADPWASPPFAPLGSLIPRQTTEVIQFVNAFIKTSNINPDDVTGVGVAIVASFAPHTGIASVTRASDLEQQLSTIFKKATRVRCFNRSQISCLLERGQGMAAGLRNDDMVYITVSNNINLGVIQQDARGDGWNWGNAGGIPHIPLTQNRLTDVASRMNPPLELALPKEVCPVCGELLCLTNLASGRAIVTAARRAISGATPTKIIDMMRARPNSAHAQIIPPDSGGSVAISPAIQGVTSIDTRAVIEAAEDQDPIALQIIRQAGLALGLVIALRVIPSFNPFIVTLGSAGARSDTLLDVVRQVAVSVQGGLIRHPTGGANVAVNFLPTAFPGYTGLLGAAWCIQAMSDEEIPLF
ncbi:MAG TPA: ROK family protein [Ktedonobacterales bacterium]|nr:ROK family protein [Ktedonobacterales bacterium]